MLIGETIFKWQEREFLDESSLSGYQVAVSAEQPHEHATLGRRPACVATSLEITSGDGTVILLGDMRSIADRDEALAPFVALRDALNKMIDRVDEAISHASHYWQGNG